jgi:hypothetical protein
MVGKYQGSLPDFDPVGKVGECAFFPREDLFDERLPIAEPVKRKPLSGDTDRYGLQFILGCYGEILG